MFLSPRRLSLESSRHCGRVQTIARTAILTDMPNDDDDNEAYINYTSVQVYAIQLRNLLSLLRAGPYLSLYYVVVLIHLFVTSICTAVFDRLHSVDLGFEALKIQKDNVQ